MHNKYTRRDARRGSSRRELNIREARRKRDDERVARAIQRMERRAEGK